MIKKIDCICGKQHREDTQVLIDHKKQFTSKGEFDVALKMGMKELTSRGGNILDALNNLPIKAVTGSGIIAVTQGGKKVEKIISFRQLNRLFKGSNSITNIRKNEYAKVLESAFI